MILTGHAGIEKDEAEVFISGAQQLTVLQLSWLERYTDNVEVGSSTLPGTTKQLTVESKQLKGKQLSTLHSALSTLYGGLAQLARASALHAEGQRFESVILHDKLRKG